MKSLITLLALFAIPCLCLAQYTYDKLLVNFLPTIADQQSFTFENLRLYPVIAKENFKKEFSGTGKYTALKQAMEKKTVKITEKKGGASVNELVIENTSKDTVIIVAGEIIKGGQQDRIINKDMLLLPKSGKKKLTVFCVEKGRWKASRPGATFSSSYAVGSAGLRKIVEKDQDQSKVWAKVDDVSRKNKTVTATGTYTAISNSKTLNAKLKTYQEFFKNKLVQPGVIGLIAVTDNKVVGCDLFATSELFQQNLESLIQIYATEAILEGKMVSIDPATVKKYADNLLGNEKIQLETLKEKGKSFTANGKKLKVTSFE